MSRRIRAFMVGFTNAFIPVDYLEARKLGETTKRINNKVARHRVRINEQISQKLQQTTTTSN
jgi:hypothetical protein